MNKNQEQLDDFVKYCANNSEQRFWQALRNWNQLTHPDENFVLVGRIAEDFNKPWEKLEDTFYRE